MGNVFIAGIKVNTFDFPSSASVFPSSLVETDSTIKNLKNILYPMSEGYPILLVGDAGVGKNALIYHINYKRNHPTYRFSFNEDTLPEDLIGSYRLLMDGSGFEWISGPLTTSIVTGASFVADEMNLASPDVIKRFSTVYENSYLDLIEGDNSRKLAKEGFNFIGTQNPAEGFEGRKSLPFDIIKNFAVVYIDPYSPDEILYILKKLYPALHESVIKACIRITLETEKKIQLGNLGKGDLEKYHFNIRSLKKICNRLTFFDYKEKFVMYRELTNIFSEPFRKSEDREDVESLIKKELDLQESVSCPAVKFDYKNSTLYCNDKKLKVNDEIKVKNLLSKIPMTEKVGIFLEKAITALAMKENLLIEFSEEKDPSFLLNFLSNICGDSNETVNLCKGIHTSDILGALKPIDTGKVDWIDGPLSKGIRNDSTILITGLEAAGAELVEKLNMLTDDARSITLPPESGESKPLSLKENSRIIALKLFRKTKSTPTISRAFRNRFTSVLFPDLEDRDTLTEILGFYLPDSSLVSVLVNFHLKIKDLSSKRVIGSANIQAYIFGLNNLFRWKDLILFSGESDDLKEVILRGGKISYINQISDPKERNDTERILESILSSGNLPDDLKEKLEDKKKTFTIQSEIEKTKWWDPSLHKRDANTGKAELKNSGSPLKKGIEINTPETGGNTKEGPDAWYGKDTRGNMGQGEPAGGGGAWGYRTEELYKNFLAKRKILWSYTILVSLSEFKSVFGKALEETELNLEKLFDPEIDISRSYQTQGRRIDARKYISFKNGRGDSKVFDKTIIDKSDERLKGVEVVFFVSKARRIFNFEYSIATLSAMLTSSYILNEHEVDFSIYAYSDRLNRKETIDLIRLKSFEDVYDEKKEEEIFNSLCVDWQGDSVEEYRIIENCDRFFSTDAQTKIIVFISDFRGQRGKMYLEDEINSRESKKLIEEVLKNTNKSYIFLGVGIGNRYIAENIFPHSIQVTSENFQSMPNLIGTELSKLILTYHSIRN
ncbi:MAG: AAA family ATPase [Leptospiraceae bacterium]|nr:AAA family ATPase [Leptospiraceae bacterium]